MKFKTYAKRFAVAAVATGLLFGGAVQLPQAHALIADDPLPATDPVTNEPAPPRAEPGPFASAISWIPWGPADTNPFANGDTFTSEFMQVGERDGIQCTVQKVQEGGLNFRNGFGDSTTSKNTNGALKIFNDSSVSPGMSWSYFQYLYHHEDATKSIVLKNDTQADSFKLHVTCKGYFAEKGEFNGPQSDIHAPGVKVVPLAGLVVADSEHMGAREYITATPTKPDSTNKQGQLVPAVKWTLLKSGFYKTPDGFTDKHQVGWNPAVYSPDPFTGTCNAGTIIRHGKVVSDEANSNSIGITSSADINNCRPTTVLFMNGGSEGEGDNAHTSFDVWVVGEGLTGVSIGAVGNTDQGDAPKSYGWAAATVARAFDGVDVAEEADKHNGEISDASKLREAKFNDDIKPRLGKTVLPDARPDYEDKSTDDDGWQNEDGTLPDVRTKGYTFTLSDGATSVAAPNLEVEVLCYPDDTGRSKAVGWIDFNQNGKFDEGEKSTVADCGKADPKPTDPNATPVPAKPVKVKLTWPVTQNITSTGLNWLRVRVSSDEGESWIKPLDATKNGEVEDYKIKYRVVRNQRSKDFVQPTQSTPDSNGQAEDLNDMFPGLADFAAGKFGGKPAGADNPRATFAPEIVLVDENGVEHTLKDLENENVKVHDPKTGALMGVYEMKIVDGKPKVTFLADVDYANKKSATITAPSEYEVPPIKVRVKGSPDFPDGIDALYTPTVKILPTEPLPSAQSLGNEPGDEVSLMPNYPKDKPGVSDGVDLSTIKLVPPAGINGVKTTGCDPIPPRTTELDPATHQPAPPAAPVACVMTVPGQGTWKVDPATGKITFTPLDGFIGDPTPIKYVANSTQGKPMGEADLKITYRKAVGKPQTSVGVQGSTQEMSLEEMFKDLPVKAETDPGNNIFSLEGADATGAVTVKDPATGKVIGKYTIDSVKGRTGKVLFTPEPDYFGTPPPVNVILTPHVGGDPIKASYQPRVLHYSLVIPLTGLTGSGVLLYGGLAVLIVAVAAVVVMRRRFAAN